MDTCTRVAESFCCPPEIIIILLIGYAPKDNKKLKKKKLIASGHYPFSISSVIKIMA